MCVPLSVIIPVFNEEKNIKRCLDSISWADEVFVVDSGSTDRTCQLAEESGAKVVQFDFNGSWPKKKNWALENLPLRNEWIFILDADEELPPEAQDEFNKICTGEVNCFEGYYINRKFFFMGKRLDHAYFPNWNLRLFKHALGRYEKLTEMVTESGDNEVHEHVKLRGKAGHLRSIMNHYAFPDIETFWEKHRRYSSWEARIAVSGRLADEGTEHLSGRVKLRRILKKISFKMPFRPFLRFFYIYIIQKGFLDGKEGFLFAKLHAMYEAQCVAKTRQLKERTK